MIFPLALLIASAASGVMLLDCTALMVSHSTARSSVVVLGVVI
jgi:hypothetical protein